MVYGLWSLAQLSAVLDYSVPITNSRRCDVMRAAKESLRDRFRLHSVRVKTVGLMVRPSVRSAIRGTLQALAFVANVLSMRSLQREG
jgi:hypothetical protein